MQESPEQFWTPEEVSEQAVIEALDLKGVEDPEAKALLDKYAGQCEAEANAKADADPDNPEASDLANIEAAMKMAILYSKTQRYKEEARQALEQARWAASQRQSKLARDLVEQIDSVVI